MIPSRQRDGFMGNSENTALLLKLCLLCDLYVYFDNQGCFMTVEILLPFKRVK